MKKTGIFLIVLATIVACKSDLEIEAAAEQRAEESFQQIKLDQVDRYPLFENCDEMQTGSQCFYRELHKLITDKLSDQIYDYKWSTQDSLVAAITVKSSGQVRYDSIVSTAKQMFKAELDSIFKSHLYPLCKIEPAIIQGVPVTTSYLVPITIIPQTELD